EALVFLGAFQSVPLLAVVGTAGILLGGWDLVTLVKRVFFGAVEEALPAGQGGIGDLNLREGGGPGPIMALWPVLGVCPPPVLDTARHDLEVVDNLVSPPVTPPAAAAGQGGAAPPALAGGRQGE